MQIFIIYIFIVYKNCAELYKAGKRKSGVYSIDPDNTGAFDVYCDQTTAGGGWTVFQKRLDGSVDFYRGWEDYKRGFGNLNGEFWLGLDKIYRLTKERSRLHVDLEETTGKTAYAEYDFFGVASERSKYKLSLGTYSGKLCSYKNHFIVLSSDLVFLSFFFQKLLFIQSALLISTSIHFMTNFLKNKQTNKQAKNKAKSALKSFKVHLYDALGPEVANQGVETLSLDSWGEQFAFLIHISHFKF